MEQLHWRHYLTYSTCRKAQQNSQLRYVIWKELSEGWEITNKTLEKSTILMIMKTNKFVTDKRYL